MAHKYRQSGKKVDFTNTTGSAITDGDLVVLAEQAGIAIESIATSAIGTIQISGVFQVVKDAGEAWTQGQKVYYNSTDKFKVAIALGDSFVGYAAVASASASVIGQVRLAPFSEEIGREVSAAATGAQSLVVADCTSGNVIVHVPNTAALTLSLPSIAVVPDSCVITVHKNSADAEIVTVGVDGSETLIGATGQIDADNDRATVRKSDTGFQVEYATIA